MIKFHNGIIEYNYSYCQQCGACYIVCPQKAIGMHALDNGLQHMVVDYDKCVSCRLCEKVCPSNRQLSSIAYIQSLQEKSFYLSYNTDEEIRRSSSSGGVCKTIIIEGLKNKICDAVYSLKKLDGYPSAKGCFYTHNNIPNYSDIPNSVYHSIMACKEIDSVKKTDRLMIIGTSCQLYALEKALKGRYNELIKVCIFCKQQKTFECTRWLGKVVGKRLSNNQFCNTRYRGDGWPGTVEIDGVKLAWEKAAALPFGRRLWCVPGCDICGDPFGLEIGADITLMDPWNICSSNELGETLVVVHSSVGERLLKSVNSLVSLKRDYNDIKLALGEDDVKMKRQLVPFFKREEVKNEVYKAGVIEKKQRRFLECILSSLPRMPFIFYQLLNRLVPLKRNKILRKIENSIS